MSICFQDQDPRERSTHIDSGEILDEIVTRSRGEIRHAQSPRITSSTPGSLEDMKPAYSPRISQRAYSPINKLKVGRSPTMDGKGLEIKQTPSPRPSVLGQNDHASSSS